MRKLYLDNIRWGIILLVVIFHVVAIFNSSGTAMNFMAPGISIIDSFAYLVNPWFMPCLFLVAGISARYSLSKRTSKQFAKERVKRLFIPFIVGLLTIAAPVCWITFTENNVFQTLAGIPAPILYIIMALSGMGPLWFLLELFVISMLFLLIRRFDNHDRLWTLGRKARISMLILFGIPAWACAQVLNIFNTFRNLLFLFLFLLGYFVFSHDEVQEEVKKYHMPLLIVAVILYFIQLYFYWGQNFSQIVNDWLVFLYAWIMILAVLGCSAKWFNFENGFTRYMNKRSFAIFVFHYLPMNFIAYYVVKYWSLPIILNYIIVLVGSSIATILLYEIIVRIPVVRKIYGIGR